VELVGGRRLSFAVILSAVAGGQKDPTRFLQAGADFRELELNYSVSLLGR
jgi:hypothetical protein